MIPDRHEILSSLYGAWRLAIRDPGGMRWLNLSAAGFWRSFFAIVLVLPLVVVVQSLPAADPDMATPSLATLLAETLAAWVIRPFLLLGLTLVLRRGNRFPALMIAWNWVSVPETALFSLVVLVIFIAPGLAGILLVLSIAAILAIDYFVTRTALDIPGGAAFAVVMAMFLASLVLQLLFITPGG